MTDATSPQSLLGRRITVTMEQGLFLLIGLVLALKLQLIFRLNVNWDEFFRLSHVHTYLRDELAIPLQTFFVHFFSWLPSVSTNEVDQVIAARLVMFGLTLGSSVLTYLIGRLFLSKAASLFSVLGLLAFSYSVEHGTAFRADPMCAFLFLLSLYLLLARPWPRIGAGLAGGVMALALMISIKASLYLPIFGMIFLFGLIASDRRRESLRDFGAFSLSLLGAFALLYGLHKLSLAQADVLEPTRFVGQTAAKMILPDRFFPRFPYFFKSLVTNPLVWGLIISGIVLVIVQTFGRGKARKPGGLVLLSFVIPLFYLMFYRNAFPYFYVFFFSPLILFSGIVFDRLLDPDEASSPWLGRGFAALLGLAVFASFVLNYTRNAPDRLASQRELLQVVHEVFPEPVPYIDRSGMVSSFPKVGFFMSSWGMETYLGADRPIMRDLIIDRRPLFLIANTPVLDLSLDPKDRDPRGLWLREDDFAILWANYIPHWGALYVVGKRLELDGPGASREFEILIPGPYSIESPGEVELDGVVYQPGSTLTLSRGPHSLAALAPGVGVVTLRWGRGLLRPDREPSRDPIFTGF